MPDICTYYHRGSPHRRYKPEAVGRVFRSRLNKCRAAVALVRSAVRCSFGVHRAPLPALVCFVERPAVRCCPLRFVLYACIVKRILYKVKRKIYKLLRFVKYV
nr:MAG TPA: hypothetical protein [Bacteriophage sp.]